MKMNISKVRVAHVCGNKNKKMKTQLVWILKASIYINWIYTVIIYVLRIKNMKSLGECSNNILPGACKWRSRILYVGDREIQQGP